MSAPSAPSTRRILTASLVGTAVEFYDFYIYATAASLVLGGLFFPKASPSAQLMSSYATFAVAFFARPVGAAFFGHFGDRIGRKSTLVASLMTMGGSTVLIGLLPTYELAGWLAPFLLCVLRFGQGFGLGGEWGGAALLAIENAPPKWRARFGMFPQLGAPVGFIAANGLFLILGLLLSPDQFKAWGWRIPFLLSAILVGLGLWVRLKITETPVFKEAMEAAEPSAVPMAEVVKRHPLRLLGGTFAVVACFAIFYLATAFALGYGVATLHYSRTTFLGVELGAIVFLAAGILIAGWWSDRTTPRHVLLAGCLGTIAVGLVMGPVMGAGSLVAIWAWLSAALFMMGFVYGPLGAFLPALFPPRVRYSGTSIAFNVGGILGGGLAPMVAQALADRGGLTPVGWYLAAAAAVSFVAIAPLKREA
ncbi:MFS transporter [Phenylobacterium soli]|uniref:MFS transporter n=1 Tax=Phenylobacterium soli TaxID=2170551 RepID=A0A328ABA6_9CAUL|nr:MFS transporter [Phenylobacterium soli]RAK51737.1 MFS transporter [Phenylobacterium soli]